jgi:acylphosphatase
MSERVRRRAVIRGRVQGVWFRGATEEQARRRGVDGWVRNRPDGSVEAVFEGAPDAVAALVEFVRRGPPAARVERVEELEEPPEGERGFAVRRSRDGSA